MPNPYVNKVVYNNNTLIDLSTDTVESANDIALGKIGHLKDGSVVTGTHQGGYSGYSIVSTDNGDGTQNLAITSNVSGSTTITENGTYDVSNYASAVVNVSGGGDIHNARIENYLVKAGVLPDDYTELEYIQSSGTEYIDTGVKYISSTDSFTLEFEPVQTPNNMLMGGGLYSNSNGEIYFGSPSGDDRFTIVETVSNNGKLTQFTTWSALVGNKHTLSKQGTTFYLDGVAKSTVQKTINAQYNLYLCTLNRGGNATAPGKIKVYSFVYSRSGTTIANLIPAKRDSDNAIGMYDTINNTFKNNAGTGTFTAGTEILYPTTIESNTFVQISDGKIIESFNKIDGVTKTQCTSTTAGKVYVLDV